MALAKQMAEASQCSLLGFEGVELKEVAVIAGLRVAIQADAELSASWVEHCDDLFSEFVLLKLYRKSKTKTVSKNLDALRGHLALHKELGTAAIRRKPRRLDETCAAGGQSEGVRVHTLPHESMREKGAGDGANAVGTRADPG